MRGQRTFLFLQGPTSWFLQQVAKELIARGHAALRINVCPGDSVFWRLPGATAYRGRLENWRAFVAEFYATHGVTDIVLLGDCRPHHTIAIAEAQSRGIRVHVTELGYLRPDWLTVERDGMSSFSHFPRDLNAIHALARSAPAAPAEPIYSSPFGIMALTDLVYNAANVLLGPLFYPHYRRHAINHPFIEYAGWIGKAALMPFRKRRLKQAQAKLDALNAPFFLFPLQLATDYQIRKHSPFGSMERAIEAVIVSFARFAPPGSHLVLKLHPLDPGLIDWRWQVAAVAAQCGCSDRVLLLDGGDLDALIARAAGVVVVNSTVGTTALRQVKPMIVLGNAIYDIPGLTFQGDLDEFWVKAKAPDPADCDAFIRVLAATIQVRGGYYSRAAVDAGARATVERMLSDAEVFPRLALQDRDMVIFRRSGVMLVRDAA